MNKDNIIEILENNKFVYDEKSKKYYFKYDINICAKFIGTTNDLILSIDDANNSLEVPVENIKEFDLSFLKPFQNLSVLIRAEEETYISVLFQVNGTSLNYFGVTSDLRVIRRELNKIDFMLKNIIDDFSNTQE